MRGGSSRAGVIRSCSEKGADRSPTWPSRPARELRGRAVVAQPAIDRLQTVRAGDVVLTTTGDKCSRGLGALPARVQRHQDGPGPC